MINEINIQMIVTTQREMRLSQILHRFCQEVTTTKSDMNVKTTKNLVSNKMSCELKKERRWKT